MKSIYLLIFAIVVISCTKVKQLPKEKYYEFLYYFDKSYQNDTISFTVRNPLMCPINVKLAKDSLNPNLENLFGHITLSEYQDTVIKVYFPNYNKITRTRYTVRYGDLNKEIKKELIGLPFRKGKEYKIIQGYFGKFSHNTIFNKYAIDFSLQIGDTITSVDDGYVVGVIEDYKDYGTSQEWRTNDKSNYITVYHPHSGLFSQYVHLNYKGALHQLGDFVKKGQPIGICGMTGFTTIPHLHFNVKIPTDENGLISTPVEFDIGIKGEDLKRKNKVKNSPKI